MRKLISRDKITAVQIDTTRMKVLVNKKTEGISLTKINSSIKRIVNLTLHGLGKRELCSCHCYHFGGEGLGPQPRSQVLSLGFLALAQKLKERSWEQDYWGHSTRDINTWQKCHSCQLWHFSLSQYLADEIDSVQHRALRIALPTL